MPVRAGSRHGARGPLVRHQHTQQGLPPQHQVIGPRADAGRPARSGTSSSGGTGGSSGGGGGGGSGGGEGGQHAFKHGFRWVGRQLASMFFVVLGVSWCRALEVKYGPMPFAKELREALDASAVAFEELTQGKAHAKRVQAWLTTQRQLQAPGMDTGDDLVVHYVPLDDDKRIAYFDDGVAEPVVLINSSNSALGRAASCCVCGAVPFDWMVADHVSGAGA